MISIPIEAGPWLRLPLWLGGGYLALCALLWAFQEKLIFHPQPLVAPPSNPAATPVVIERGDATLRGWIVNDAAAGPLIVYYGGNAEEVSWNINNFAQRAATTVLVNYRGYGESTGAPSERKLVADAVAVVEWARQRHPGRPLVLFGSSLGTGVAALAAAQVKPDALILVSPYRSLVQVAQGIYPIFPVRWLMRHPFRADRVADDLPRTLVAASPIDRVIPFKESQAMVEAMGANVKFQSYSLRHGEALQHPPFWQAVDEFLDGPGRQQSERRSPRIR